MSRPPNAGEALWRRLTVPVAHRRALLDAFRDEVLREAAAKIRTDAGLRAAEGLPTEADYGRELANLIDPDKDH